MIGENEESFIIEKHFVNKFKFGELRKSLRKESKVVQTKKQY